MQGPSKVAWVIVNYNGGPTVIKCLEAVSRQTLSPHRIIVVDNASGDNSPFLIKKEFPKVEVISNKLNLGFSAANNIAVKEAHDCNWVALLNPDAFPEPAWLENLMRAVDQYPDYSFFGSTQLKYGVEDQLDGSCPFPGRGNFPFGNEHRNYILLDQAVAAGGGSWVGLGWLLSQVIDTTAAMERTGAMHNNK